MSAPDLDLCLKSIAALVTALVELGADRSDIAAALRANLTVFEDAGHEQA